MKDEGYSIKDLEVLSGVKAHTIRIWEKRYNLLRPARTDTNIRYYSDDDLRRMLNVSLLVRVGNKISKIATWTDEKISEKVLEISQRKTSGSDYIDRLILHMVNFDNHNFSKVTSGIIAEMGLEEAVTKVFFDFFERLGMYWQVGSVFPAQEHYVSNIFRQKLIAETDKLGIDDRRGKTMLVFLPGNEMHELSLLFYSYVARKMGYHIIYLGQFVPWKDLEKIGSQVKIDFCLTAFINSISKEELEQSLESLHGLFSKQTIFITGSQLRIHKPVLPRNVKIVKDYKEFMKLLE